MLMRFIFICIATTVLAFLAGPALSVLDGISAERESLQLSSGVTLARTEPERGITFEELYALGSPADDLNNIEPAAGDSIEKWDRDEIDGAFQNTQHPALGMETVE